MNTIPFDIEKAKAGVPVITRCGLNARIISFDRKHESFNLVVLVPTQYDEESVHIYNSNGNFLVNKGPSPLDLFHPAPEMYVNVYANNSVSLHTYQSVEDAKNAATKGTVYKLVKVE